MAFSSALLRSGDKQRSALAILLYGLTQPLQKPGQVLAVGLTAIALSCWHLHFRPVRK